MTSTRDRRALPHGVAPEFVGLLLGRSPTPALVALLGEITRRYPVVAAAGIEPERLAGCIWYADWRTPPEGVPVAAWLGDEADAAHPVSAAARLRIADRPVADAVVIPPDTAHPDSAPVAPHVRRRLRAARGLPAVAIGSADGESWTWSGEPVGASLRDTVAANASAVTAVGNEAVRALAWGAPTVTDAETADTLGLPPGAALVADDPERRAALAAELADDDRLSAGLSWAARRHYEQRHDLGWVALQVLSRLVGPAAASRPRRRLDTVLASLGTGPGHPVAGRAHALVGDLPDRPHEETT